MTLKFLDKVNCKSKLVRKQSFYNKKIWQEHECNIKNAVYLGKRTVSDGTTNCDDDGIYYSPDKHYSVALLIENENTNPFYASFESITNSGKEKENEY